MKREQESTQARHLKGPVNKLSTLAVVVELLRYWKVSLTNAHIHSRYHQRKHLHFSFNWRPHIVLMCIVRSKIKWSIFVFVCVASNLLLFTLWNSLSLYLSRSRPLAHAFSVYNAFNWSLNEHTHTVVHPLDSSSMLIFWTLCGSMFHDSLEICISSRSVVDCRFFAFCWYHTAVGNYSILSIM